MTTTNDSRQKITAIAAVVAVLLLGLVAFLLYNKVSTDKQLKAQAMELDETNRLKAELEKNYYEALSDLEEMKGDNEELNALIEGQKDELKLQREKVDGLIRSGKNNKRDLVSAREEITALQGQRDQFMAEITTLQEQNAQLADANQNLNQEKDVLIGEVASERTNVANLTTEKAVLVSEKEVLQVEKEDLTTKVDFASVVKVADVGGTGWKFKKSGKSSLKTYAKNVDEMKICFTTTPNKLSGSGKETFLIRLINPTGETMAVEEMGSGVFTNTKTGQEIRYTQSVQVSYPQEEGKDFNCINWAPNAPFVKGLYEIEIYNEGYLSGKGKCVLK